MAWTGFGCMHSKANCVHWVNLYEKPMFILCLCIFSVHMIKIRCIIGMNIPIREKKTLQNPSQSIKTEQLVLSPQGPTITLPILPDKWKHKQLLQPLSTFSICPQTPERAFQIYTIVCTEQAFLLLCDLCVLSFHFFE